MSLGISVHQGGAESSSLGPNPLNMDTVLERLHQHVPGINADFGGRLDLWHPRINDKQGVFFGSRHICSADRGWSPQWPVFTTKQEMCSVPLNYALLHEDFPVLDITPSQNPEDFSDHLADNGVECMVLRPKLDDVAKLGWAEVFWKLIQSNIPGVDAYWLSTEFRVPMDWIHRYTKSPVNRAFTKTLEHCGAT